MLVNPLELDLPSVLLLIHSNTDTCTAPYDDKTFSGFFSGFGCATQALGWFCFWARHNSESASFTLSRFLVL